MKLFVSVLTVLWMFAGPGAVVLAQSGPSFLAPLVTTNREVQLSVSGTKALNYRIDAAPNPAGWEPIILATNGNGEWWYI